jgi:hypothetical protein
MSALSVLAYFAPHDFNYSTRPARARMRVVWKGLSQPMAALITIQSQAIPILKAHRTCQVLLPEPRQFIAREMLALLRLKTAFHHVLMTFFRP